MSGVYEIQAWPCDLVNQAADWCSDWSHLIGHLLLTLIATCSYLCVMKQQSESAYFLPQQTLRSDGSAEPNSALCGTFRLGLSMTFTKRELVLGNNFHLNPPEYFFIKICLFYAWTWPTHAVSLGLVLGISLSVTGWVLRTYNSWIYLANDPSPKDI